MLLQPRRRTVIARRNARAPLLEAGPRGAAVARARVLGRARGWSNRRVADELKIAEGTVKTRLKRIFGKLYARNRTEAVVIARRKGLLRT